MSNGRGNNDIIYTYQEKSSKPYNGKGTYVTSRAAEASSTRTLTVSSSPYLWEGGGSG